jgi:hypothetical protein
MLSKGRTLFAGTLVVAVAIAITATVAIYRYRSIRADGSHATPDVARNTDSSPHFFVPTVKTTHTVGANGAISLYAIKNDGSVWERRVTGGTDVLTFTDPVELTPARGARGFGISIVARADGGIVTRQPYTGEWTSSPGFLNLSKELPVSGEQMLQLEFPSGRTLFSGGTFFQGDAPLGERLKSGRLRRFWMARNVVQWGLGERSLAALFSDGSLVSVGRGQQGKMECVAETAAVSLAVSPVHGTAAFADGSVRMWGDLSLGQLGAAGQSRSPLTVVPGLQGITHVAVSEIFGVMAVALDRDGHVWEWGAIGRKEFVPPRRVEGLSGITYVQFDLVAIALAKDGTAWAFQPTTGRAPQKVFDGLKPTEDLRIAKPATSPCKTANAPRE